MSQPKIAKNLLKPLILGVQNHPRSSMLTFLRSLSPMLVMISSMSVPICKHFHVRRPNTGKSFRGGAPLSPSRLWEPPWPRACMKFCPEILETLGYHTVKTRSFYLTWAWNGTGTWQTPRRTELCHASSGAYKHKKTLNEENTWLILAWSGLHRHFAKLFGCHKTVLHWSGLYLN